MRSSTCRVYESRCCPSICRDIRTTGINARYRHLPYTYMYSIVAYISRGNSTSTNTDVKSGLIAEIDPLPPPPPLATDPPVDLFRTSQHPLVLSSITDCRIRWDYRRRGCIPTRACCTPIRIPSISWPTGYRGYPRRRGCPTAGSPACRTACRRPTARRYWRRTCRSRAR